MGYSNKIVDQKLTEAATETDKAKADQLMQDVDIQMWKDLPTIPLYQKPTYIAWRNTFVNIGDNSTQDGPFWNANLWGQKTA